MLEFSINGQIITRNDEDPIVRDSQNYVIAYFLGDEEWRSHGTVTAVFKGADGQIFNMILSYDPHYGHSCLVPWEVLTQPWFEVSAFCGNLITANTVKVFTIKSGYDSTRDSRIPTPDVYNQIIEQLNRIEDEVDPDAVKAFVDEYLEGKDFVTESDVQTILENYISVTPILQSGTKIAEINVNGETTEIFAPEGGGGASSLSSLSDTSISSPSSGDVLVYDGEKWKNAEGVLNEEYSNDISAANIWESGTINHQGVPLSDNTRLRTAVYVEATDNLILHINDDSYEYGICLYADVNTQIETEKFYYDADLKENVQYARYFQRDVSGKELLEIFPTLRYIKVIMRNVASTTPISPSEYNKISLDYQDDTNSLISYLDKISKIIWQSSGVIKIKNAINSLAEIWQRWNGRLAFGMNTSSAPVPLEIEGQLYANGTIIAHNTGSQNNNRWGVHIYEGYSLDNYSRMTMLLDKHRNEMNGKPSLEYYYYTGASHRAQDYGSTKIGSDAKYHSFFFNRDEFTCVGLADFRFPITLARLDPSTLNRTYSTVADLDAHVDAETDASNHLSSLRYIYLKNAENGTMFYDTARAKVVCKINNAWCDLAYTDASSNYPYL